MNISDMNTAIILAGGLSKRMGYDKRFIYINGKPIINFIVEKLKKSFNNIIIVKNSGEKIYNGKGCEEIIDKIKNYGPLGGLYTALLYSSSQYIYLTACDMPFINNEYIQYMKNILTVKGDNLDSLVTSYKEVMVEPFNAFYSKRALPFIEDAIKKDLRQINSILKHMNTQYISEERAKQFSSNWKMFTNINTKKELQKLFVSNMTQCQ